MFFAELNGVVSVFPDDQLQLLTTHSWDFLGMPLNVERNIHGESDVIVCMLDTGIYPESPSFKDEGMGPVPAKWKGGYDSSLNFTCNRKLIGARDLRMDLKGETRTPRDTKGHGTHTASIAAGAVVSNASFFGLANGTARGGVPSSRIAVYKVCGGGGSCIGSDIMAAFDNATVDGCDIISVSIAASKAKSYFEDPIAIGSLHAHVAGVLTSAAAGNFGPNARSLSNAAPWLMSVAACTTDRSFSTDVSLGDGNKFTGISINPVDLYDKPLIYGVDAKNKSFTDDDSRQCKVGSLDTQLVQDKIVLCESLSDTGAFLAGASGTILANDNSLDLQRIFPRPASQITAEGEKSVLNYTKLSASPTATIQRSVETRKMTPFVVSFSSRGPNPITPAVLKPDFCAPGVAILASWPNATSPTGLNADDRRVTFNFLTGTSMACPHATAAAAYIKSFNPTFSPSAIQSAVITTASPVNPDKLAEFSYGAGQIDPRNARDPGLVYEANYLIEFLCQQGVPEYLLRLIFANQSISCTFTGFDLNLASIAYQSNSSSFSTVVTRRVKNVGSNTATYKASVVTSSPSVTVIVEPAVLDFRWLGQEKRFVVTINGTIDDKLVSGSVVWDDGTHKVRTPIVIFRNL